MPGTVKQTRKAAAERTAKVVVLDDQPIIRERVAQLVGGEPDLALCGEADECHQAMQMIAAARPDLVITSLSLRNCHGLDFVKDLSALYPDLPILVFSAHDELLYGERAIRAGARGFIHKQESTKELLRAIRTLLEGEIYLSQRLTVAKVTRFFTASSCKASAQLERLSDRELQVLQLIGQGQSTRQIASALRLDVKTIETYRARLKEKLKLNSTAELLQHAQQWLDQSTRS